MAGLFLVAMLLIEPQSADMVIHSPYRGIFATIIILSLLMDLARLMEPRG